MKTEHTPTPWDYYTELPDFAGFFATERNCDDPDFRITFEGHVEESEMLATSRRIVACVNACQGLSNEFLESGGIKELIRAVKAARIAMDIHAKLNEDETVRAVEDAEIICSNVLHSLGFPA